MKQLIFYLIGIEEKAEIILKTSKIISNFIFKLFFFRRVVWKLDKLQRLKISMIWKHLTIPELLKLLLDMMEMSIWR